MNYQIKNDKLCVTISSLGAEILSAKRGDVEYMWQREGDFWKGTAPVLFPICGRLWEGAYTYKGKRYEMNLHGFARKTEYTVKSASDTEIAFSLVSNEATKAIYPFDFDLTVAYALDGDTVKSTITVKNTDTDRLPFAVGLHPGFNVPLEEGKKFDDYYVEFATPCTPKQIVFSETCFLTDERRDFATDGNKIHLYHSMFDNDAIFLQDVANSVTLKCDGGKRFVKFDYPDMQFMGLWHTTKSEAPFVCIEPWCSLPATDGEVDDFDTKPNFFRTAPGEVKSFNYSLTFGEN